MKSGPLTEDEQKIIITSGKKCNKMSYRIDSGNFIVGADYPSIDHLMPMSKGGTHTWDNVKLAHHGCNTLKRDKIIYEEPSGQLSFAL